MPKKMPVKDKKNLKKELDIQFSQLSRQSNQYHGFSSEAIHLLIQLKRKHKQKFNCSVIELKQSPNHSLDLSPIQALTQIKPSKKSVRIQLIVKNGGHFTTLDILLGPQGGSNHALVLDAIGDKRSHLLTHQLLKLEDENGKKFFDRIYYPTSNNKECTLQEDSFSCPIFAYDHACQAAKLDNLFNQLAECHQNAQENKRLIILNWLEMPASLVRNAQSATFIETYIAQHPETEKTFNIKERFQKKYHPDGQASATELLLQKYQSKYNQCKRVQKIFFSASPFSRFFQNTQEGNTQSWRLKK